MVVRQLAVCSEWVVPVVAVAETNIDKLAISLVVSVKLAHLRQQRAGQQSMAMHAQGQP
jgi:hypothetical protein